MSDIPAARRARIRALVREQGIVSLQDVKGELGVSEMTIRRDFAALEQSGALQRTRGGVMAVQRVLVEEPYNQRQDLESEAKRAIGRFGAGLVEEGDSLFLSGGTTVLAMARALSGRSRITVISNSVTTISQLMTEPGMTVLSTGGRVMRLGGDLTGPLAEAALRQFQPQKAFIGASGVTPEGVFNVSLESAATDRLIVESGAEIYVLADHTKLGRLSLALVSSLEGVTAVVTDAEVSHEDAAWLEETGVQVLVSPSEEDQAAVPKEA